MESDIDQKVSQTNIGPNARESCPETFDETSHEQTLQGKRFIYIFDETEEFRISCVASWHPLDSKGVPKSCFCAKG